MPWPGGAWKEDQEADELRRATAHRRIEQNRDRIVRQVALALYEDLKGYRQGVGPESFMDAASTAVDIVLEAGKP